MAEQTILSPQESSACLMALAGMIEDLTTILGDSSLPFTPEARRDMGHMITAAISAKLKMEAIANNGQAFKLDTYREGDENKFFTKQS